MGVKSFIEEHFPYPALKAIAGIYSALKFPYVSARYFIRERARRREMESIIARAEKFRPYYQDELSHEILSGREKYLIERDSNIFMSLAVKQGVVFDVVKAYPLSDTKKTFRLYIEKHSDVAVICECSEQAMYLSGLLKYYGWRGNLRLVNFDGLMRGEVEIHKGGLIVSVLRKSWQTALIKRYAKKHKISGEILYIYSAYSDAEEYFDVFPPVDNEIIIDAGCYDGDTAIRFLKWGGEKVKHVYSFEFDPDNVLMCRKNLEPYMDRVTLIEKGTWDREETLRVFSDGTTASNVFTEGSVEVHLTTIDSVVKDEPVTFIKMDVEGSELKSLMGAKNTIIKNRPRLVICMYHKPEDLCEIPEYILSIVPEYKFYLRHYSSSSASTILYAYC